MTQPVLLEFGGTGQPLLFSHANGYPPGSYRALFEALGGSFSIGAMEHRPLWGAGGPPQRRLNWRVFAGDLLDLMAREYQEPVWVMGHSMGATIATLAAAREPERFAGIILLDPVFLSNRVVLGMRLMSRKRLQGMPMIRKARERPAVFASHDDAFAFYRDKRAFRGLSDATLRDYVMASKAPREEGGVALRYPGAWEAAIYGSAPWMPPVLKRVKVPVVGLRGRDTDTLSSAMWQRWQHWQPHGRFAQITGGHLFPLENPDETAEVIASLIFPA